MGPEWVAILALIALFVAGTALPINMGALAYVAAWLVGMYSLGLDEKEILAGVSGDLILTLIGVTYLFAVARNNGTVDLIVNSAVRAVGGRVAFIPWVMFAVTAVLTAIGAASPAACAIIGPIALGFAGRYGINPLMMGMFLVHGAQGGGFSPISIYGTITNSVMEEANLPSGEMTVFLASLAINLVMAGILFALFGRDLLTRRVEVTDIGATVALPDETIRAGHSAPAGASGTRGGGRARSGAETGTDSDTRAGTGGGAGTRTEGGAGTRTGAGGSADSRTSTNGNTGADADTGASGATGADGSTGVDGGAGVEGGAGTGTSEIGGAKAGVVPAEGVGAGRSGGEGLAADDPSDEGAGEGAPGSGGVRSVPGSGRSAVAGRTTRRYAEAGGTGETPNAETTPGGSRRDHVLTLVAFAAVAIVALAFDKNIGFVAITAAVVLAMLSPTQHRDAIRQIAWPTVLLVAGVSTYATVLNAAGSPEFVGKWAAGLGAVVIGALVLCYVGGVVSAFASSTALLPVIIPIGVPLIVDGGINAALFVAALAIASTIVDVSPFSTNGALILANRPETIPEASFYRQILTYSVIVVLVGPLLVWAALVLPA